MSAQGEWSEALNYSEAIAIRAFGFLSASEAELERFLTWSGLTRGDLEYHATSRGNLVGVLDFLVSNEAALMRFANTVDVPPEEVYEARRVFSHAAMQAAAD